MGLLSSCHSSETPPSLVQVYLGYYPEITSGMVFVLPQNACIPCNKKAYTWWVKHNHCCEPEAHNDSPSLASKRGSENPKVYIITDYLNLRPSKGSCSRLFTDTVGNRLMQHNPYVTKAYVMVVASGQVTHHFPIEPSEIPSLETTLSKRLQTIKP